MMKERIAVLLTVITVVSMVMTAGADELGKEPTTPEPRAPGEHMQAAGCPCNGDVDNDQDVDKLDGFCIIDAILGGDPALCPKGDVNCDGVIDGCDLAIVLDQFMGLLQTCDEPCGACCLNSFEDCPLSDLCLCHLSNQRQCEMPIVPFLGPGTYFGDGTTCNPSPCDCNGNEIPDGDEIAADPSLDCDDDGNLDECEQPDPSTVGGCCVPGREQCTVVDLATCDAIGGIWSGPCTDCPEQNVVVVIEPGGEIFIHVIGPPVDCLNGGGVARAAGGCPPTSIDPWVSSAAAQMCHQFGVTDSPAIPADFFGPGSDPFTGTVCLEGVPLGPTPFGDFGSADTLIERTGDPFDRCDLPSAAQAIVSIEIVALSLKNVNPVTVTFNGGQNPEQWDVVVDLSIVTPPAGTLTATKTHCNGGTYTSELNVQPRFSFTRAVPPDGPRVLDTGLAGIAPVTLVQSTPLPWVSDVDPLLGVTIDLCSDFHAGIQDVPILACDCNANGVRDLCDIETGTSRDCNADGKPDECLPCVTDCECNDLDICTQDECIAGSCVSTPGKIYGDVDNDGDVDLFDLFCLLNCFSSDFSVCSFDKCDLEPCGADADVDLFDLFAVLNAFSGDDPCCGG